MKIEFDEEMLEDKVGYLMDMLEQEIPKDVQAKFIQQLYLLSMGEYTVKSDSPLAGDDSAALKKRKLTANTLLNKLDSLKPICVLFHSKIVEMSKVENKGMDNSNLILELELRMACNILINFCLYNNDDTKMILDFINFLFRRFLSYRSIILTF